MTRKWLFSAPALVVALMLCSINAWPQDPFSNENSNSNASGAFLNASAAALDVIEEPDFLPVDVAYPLAVDRDAQGDVLLFWPIHDAYYLYKKRFSFNAVKNNEQISLDAVFPKGVIREDEFFGRSEVFYGELTVRLQSASLTPPFILEIRSQGCADAGLCYPPQKQYFEIGADPGSIVAVSADAVSAFASTTQAQRSANSPPLENQTESNSLWMMCLFALLGGMILNLMPCVFPILSLKVLSFAGSGFAGSGGTEDKLSHGLAYTLGVVLSFVAVAGLLLMLRSGGAAVGWGFHLQAPWFVALLAYLFFAMGLSLSGLVEFGASLMGTGQGLASREGLSGSFFTGVLATVVASPCTAPFMGTALGFALTQSSLIALVVFASLGLGMALPFLLLSAFPALLRRLPRPGPWMLTFRQFMAFPMYAAAVWLLWVLGRQTGVNGMASVAGGAVLVAMCLWFWSNDRSERLLSVGHTLALSALLAALMILSSPLLSPQTRAATTSAEWEVYSREREQQLRNEGQPYFVNITADWCLTCLANEHFALSDSAVRNAFKEYQLVYLKGDWTNSDPRLTAVLREHGRSGVPLYLLASADGQVRLLPQLLTPGLVLDSLHETLQTSKAPSIEISQK